MTGQSAVAARLKTALEPILARTKQKDIADSMHVSEALLSKRVGEVLTKPGKTPPDEWIIRFAMLARMSPQDTQDLVTSAHVERSAANKQVRGFWEKLRVRLRTPQAVVAKAIAETVVLHDVLRALGVEMSLEEIELFRKKQRPSHRDTKITEMDLSALSDLHQELRVFLESKAGLKLESFPTLGQLLDKLAFRLDVRSIRPTEEFEDSPFEPKCGKALGAGTGRIRCMPILPGLLAYLIELKQGDRTEDVHHAGIEATIALEGQAQVFFRGTSFTQTATNHEIILYNSSVPHHVECSDGSAMLLMLHFDETLFHRWPRVMEVFEKYRARAFGPDVAEGGKKNLDNLS